MESKWKYRIEPHRQIPGERAWTRANEAEATAWFGFRECGDDHRCFGVFPTRRDAERAMEMLKGVERSSSESFHRMLDDKSSPQAQEKKQQDRGIER